MRRTLAALALGGTLLSLAPAAAALPCPPPTQSESVGVAGRVWVPGCWLRLDA